MKILLYTSRHHINDIRIAKKFAVSLSKKYNVTIFSKRDNLIINQNIDAKPRKALNVNFNEFDIIQLNDPIDFVKYFIFSLLSKDKKFVYDFHEDIPSQILHKKYLGKLRRFISFLSLLFIKVFNITNQNSISATFHISKRLKKTTIIQNKSSIKPRITNTINAKKKINIIYFGNLTDNRGAAQIKTLLNYDYIENLHFFGSHNDDKSSVELVQNPKCISYGMLEMSEADSICSRITNPIGIFLPKRLPNYLESFPTKIADYLTIGIPFIISRFEMWETLFFDYHNQILFCDKVNDVRENDLRNLKYNLKPNFNFSWITEESKLLKFYENV